MNMPSIVVDSPLSHHQLDVYYLFLFIQAEERFTRKRDALMQRKLYLENRRALLATRRTPAIRIMSSVLHLASVSFLSHLC